jgi:hypothetical protein
MASWKISGRVSEDILEVNEERFALVVMIVLEASSQQWLQAIYGASSTPTDI